MYVYIYIYIALKHVIWRSRICIYFRKMFKFLDFMNTLRNFKKSDFACIFTTFKYLAKQLILMESPDNVLYNDIQYVHILKSVPRSLAKFPHSEIVQSPHENHFNICQQHKGK